MSLPSDTEASIRHYEDLLAREPDYADGHFNLALLYKMERRYTDALAEYQQAIRLGIDRIEEVYSNVGVLYSDMRKGDRARAMYEKALEVDPQYIPALFNLAGLFEETGERGRAVDLYRRILDIDPGHWDSLARLAYAKRVRNADDEIIDAIRSAIATAGADSMAREGLSFALGKVLDDVGKHAEAFAAYGSANEHGKLRHPPYDRSAAEDAVSMMMELFDRDWLDRAACDSDASPIFICGMYRSGSTLVEQILAGHPEVTAGGELDILPWLATRRLTPFPERLRGISASEIEAFAGEYLAGMRQLFPGAQHVTDKRPDNFVHLGLIRAMFPHARIVYTSRDLRDNCLSVYFQQLGANLAYATDLGNTAHYYRQHQRLMAHWQNLIGESIHTVCYDELVHDPEPVLKPLFEFLGLPWDDRCLKFRESRSLVKTASVWQVREPLHTRSSGRWQQYAPFIDTIEEFGKPE